MLNPNEKNDPNIDWQDLSFRRRSRITEASSDHRFAIGLGVFILVALLFPWYAYEVVSYSLERDTIKALNQFGIETQNQIDEANAASQRQLAANAEHQLRQRIAGVRVMGVSAGGNLPTVLVALGNSNIQEAQGTICQQASAWLDRNISGATIRIQSHRGSRPTVDAGAISC
jgi:hypothetical protein